jgi:hypothetical protein
MTKSPPEIAAMFSVKPFAVVPRITSELDTALAIFQRTGSSAAGELPTATRETTAQTRIGSALCGL